MVQEYLELVRYVLENGAKKTDRTGTGTLSLFGLQTRYDLPKGFPLLTTKKVLFDTVVHELLWFLRGSTNIHDGLTQFFDLTFADIILHEYRHRPFIKFPIAV